METIGNLIRNVATTVSKYSNEIGNYLASKTDKKNSKLKIIGQLGMAVAMPWASKDILDSVEKIKETSIDYFSSRDEANTVSKSIKDVLKEQLLGTALNSKAGNFITDCFPDIKTMEYSKEEQIEDEKNNPVEPIGKAPIGEKENIIGNIVELLTGDTPPYKPNNITNVEELGLSRPYVGSFVNRNINMVEDRDLTEQGFYYGSPVASTMLYGAASGQNIYDQILEQYNFEQLN